MFQLPMGSHDFSDVFDNFIFIRSPSVVTSGSVFLSKVILLFFFSVQIRKTTNYYYYYYCKLLSFLIQVAAKKLLINIECASES